MVPKMSAAMFSHRSDLVGNQTIEEIDTRDKTSRIPTPILRRSLSMRRMRTYSNSDTFDMQETTPPAVAPHHQRALLKRGNSFMERGEKSLGQRNGVAPRPKNLTDAINRSGGGNTARTRSLSLSTSSHQSTSRLSSPKSPHHRQEQQQATSVLMSPKTPPTSPNVNLNFNNGTSDNVDWETESLTSITSLASVGSCDHASIARNGTTFSGRSMKYVFHCNQHSGETDEYLTPTQRVHRQVKKLKHLLHQAKKELDDKDSDIRKLTKEVVELRLYKAALNSPEDKSNSSECVTVREQITDEEITPDAVDNVSLLQNDLSRALDMNSSYTDSGHFEDFSQSPAKKTAALKCDKSVNVEMFMGEHTDLIVEYEKRFQELVKTHEDESHQLKQKHNDKVEELLQRITEINKRYWELVPELDTAKDRIRELESRLEEACKKLEQQDEEKQKSTLLEMFQQGQEAARLEREAKVMDMVRQGPSRISVPELLQELQVTKNELENIKDVEYASTTSNSSKSLLSAKEALSLWVLGARKAMYRQLVDAKNKNKIDPEITLQFLKSAVYYFLTDRENSQGHLKAIQSILGFTPSEIVNIDKAYWQS